MLRVEDFVILKMVILECLYLTIDSDGNLLMRMSDDMAIDMDKGDIHFISRWSDEEDDWDVKDGHELLYV